MPTNEDGSHDVKALKVTHDNVSYFHIDKHKVHGNNNQIDRMSLNFDGEDVDVGRKKQNTCRRKVKLDTSSMTSKFRLIFYTWFFCWSTYLVSDLFDLYRLYLASTLSRLGGNETQSHVYAFLNRSR